MKKHMLIAGCTAAIACSAHANIVEDNLHYSQTANFTYASADDGCAGWTKSAVKLGNDSYVDPGRLALSLAAIAAASRTAARPVSMPTSADCRKPLGD
jgi:hypothetical protein